MSQFERTAYWAEMAGWMVLIYCLSGDSFAYSRTLIALQYWSSVFHLPLTEADLQLINLTLRKTAHVTEYFILGLLLYRALSGGLISFRFSLACWALAGGGSYALADEFHQWFTKLRTPSLGDSCLDFSGVIASQVWTLIRSSMFQAGGWSAWLRKARLDAGSLKH